MKRRNSGKFLNARYWSCYALFNVLIILGLALVLCTAFRLQIVQHSVWLERGRAQTEASLRVQTCRGSIYDRQGRLLSFSVPQKSVFADSDQVENPRQMAAQLAPILRESEGALEKKLSCGRRFVWLKRHLTDQQALAVEELKGRGLNLIHEYKRFYPYRQVAGQVVGFVGLDGVGLEGVEKSFDSILRENSTTVGQVRDGTRKRLWLEATPPPETGENAGVRLTLDAFIQYLSEVELEKAALQYHARAAEVVVLDPETFEVLAMANWPAFDPNLEEKKNADAWRNRTITDAFEPGSTFKVFLVSGALEGGVIKERDRVFCENGKCVIAGHTVNDVHPYGWLTISEVVKYSSNIAASKLAMKLGAERYAHTIHAFGFGKPTGISLPGEAKGLVRSSKRWRPIDLAATGFGQSIGVTSLQLTRAIAGIANGGRIGEPLIAGSIVDPQGQPVRPCEIRPMHRVIQEKTARQIRDMMKGVTEEGGTGVNAAPDGYTAAGKTGTAQVLEPGTRRYASNKYTSIFTGFIPADRPRLVMTVVVHDPKGASYGGVVAAPVFRNIAAKALPYLGVVPSDVGPGSPPAVRMVRTAVEEHAKAAAVSAPSETDPALMPDLTGLSLKMALKRLSPLGMRAKLQGSGKVIGQFPQAGTPLASKTQVELVLNDVR